MPKRDKFIGTCAAAKELGVSVRTVQLWSEKGILDAWKTSGGHRRITRESVARVRNAYKNSHTQKASTILVVEDDATMQAYYEALLAIVAPDADIIVAQNGYEGLIAFGKHG
ncbi:MAG: helix-turn-helix domain-containing protein, partial [Pseudomonadota bacterium]